MLTLPASKKHWQRHSGDLMNRNLRKAQQGTVVSTAMKNTVVVKVSQRLTHPRYGKVITRNQKYYAHCEGEPIAVGERVTIAQTRPLSKLKRWRVVSRATSLTQLPS